MATKCATAARSWMLVGVLSLGAGCSLQTAGSAPRAATADAGDTTARPQTQPAGGMTAGEPPAPSDPTDLPEAGAPADAGTDAADAGEGSEPPDAAARAPGSVGTPCQRDDDCTGIPGQGFGGRDNPGMCVTDTGGFLASQEIPGGYCSASCFSSAPAAQRDAPCGDDAVCGANNRCLQRCQDDDDCRAAEGYFCDESVGGCSFE